MIMAKNHLPNIPLSEQLPEKQHQFLRELSQRYRFTFQQLKMLTEFSADLHSWNQGSLEDLYSSVDSEKVTDKQASQILFEQFRKGYERIKNSKKTYPDTADFLGKERKFPDAKMTAVELRGKIMGQCPVASEKTRCCNLNTLDAVQQCGFDCSYCSIQSFYHGDRVRFVENIEEHLEALELDSDKLYHIGTGQSSDSLMWGNKSGLLDSICRFADKHPNVILEMKTKSSRIDYFLENSPPGNMIFTWSLNTPLVIQHEEKGTANLIKRLESARKLADLGCPVGFHFHPIVWYEGWQNDYIDLVTKLTAMFQPREVVMISLGTLTFIKSVVKRIRNRMMESSILQMPMEDSAGKLSYPFTIKKDLFSTVYQAFPTLWKENVFFYMCMEHIDLWDLVLGRSYQSNEQFEQDMLKKYNEKLLRISS